MLYTSRRTVPGAAAFLRGLRKSYPLSLAALARFPLLSPAVTSSPGRGKSALKGTPLRYAGNFTVTAKSRPLGEGGCEHSEQTEGVSPTGCIQIDISICCVSRLLIYQLGEIRTFFALLIYQFGLGSYSTEGRESGKRREQRGAAEHKKLQAER
mgnify:CR=1 FL=1